MDALLSSELVAELGPTLTTLLAVAVAALAGFVLHAVVFRLLRRTTPPEESHWRKAFEKNCRRPLRWLLPIFLAAVTLPAFPAGEPVTAVLGRLLSLLLIVTVAWFFVGVTGAAQDLFLERFRVDVRDNLRARKVHTQVDILRKIVIVGIAIVAFAAVLMSYERLRELGTGLLASAGIAGLVIGLAAQRTLANILAGFQLALTQPIRIDDVVIVEGEWGRIEEITLTYVVVQIWDRRRLVVPISHFIERPFQNWTRVSAEILGTVFLRLDYTVPVPALREALHRILEESEHWDGEVGRLHVTEATDRTLEVRALMSAADSGTAWELRCEVREKLVEWVREWHPGALPRVRAEAEVGGAIAAA